MSKLRVETECQCTACRMACKYTPCAGTPADIQKLIDAGYKDKLSWYLFQSHLHGELMLWPYVSGKLTDKGCIFFNEKGLCDLHDKKLKPTEGRFAHHTQPDNGLKKYICYQWCSPEGIAVMKQFEGTDELIRILENIHSLKKTK